MYQTMGENTITVGALAVRFLIGAAVVWLVVIRRPVPREPGLVRAGIVCGSVLCAGYIFQTVGLQYISSSVSAFITYLLVLIVPLLAAAVLKRPPTVSTVVGIVLAVADLEVAPRVARVVVGQGVALYGLVPARRSLEDVFVSLVEGREG